MDNLNKLTPQYDSKTQCLYCGKTFKIEKLRSRFINIIKKDADFCCHFDGVNPYFYEVRICPYCKFAFTDNFNFLRNKDVVKQEYIDKINIQNVNFTRDAENSLKAFKLVLICARLSKQSNFVIANICLKIAWLNRHLGDKEEENRFLKNALSYFQKTYEEDDLIAERINKDMLVYLIAELYGRLGYYEKARRFFSIIISNKATPQKILKISRERWLDYRVKYNKNTEGV